MKIGKDGLKIGTATITVMSIYFSRGIVAKYGENSRVIIITLIIGFFLLSGIYQLYKGNIKGAVLILSITIPFIVSAIGLLLNNMLILIAGITLLFIVLFIVLKYLNWYIKNK